MSTNRGQQGGGPTRGRAAGGIGRNACFLCIKARAVCDGGSPCSRCAALRVPHMCLSSETIFSRAARVYAEASQGLPQPNQQPMAAAAAAAATATAAARPPSQQPQQSQGQHPTVDPAYILRELVVMRKEQRKLLDEMQQLRRQNERLELALASSSSSSSSSSSAATTAEKIRATSSNRPLRRGPQVAQASSMASGSSVSTPLILVPDDGLDITDQVGSLASPVMAAAEAAVGQAQQQQCIVVFDLSQNPATVVNVTDPFARLLGYTVEEMLGTPWVRLVTNPERTWDALQRGVQTSSTVVLEQEYRRKDGSVATALDTHRIMICHGRPIVDVVAVSPHQAPVPAITNGSPDSSAVAAAAAAQFIHPVIGQYGTTGSMVPPRVAGISKPGHMRRPVPLLGAPQAQPTVPPPPPPPAPQQPPPMEVTGTPVVTMPEPMFEDSMLRSPLASVTGMQLLTPLQSPFSTGMTDATDPFLQIFNDLPPQVPEHRPSPVVAPIPQQPQQQQPPSQHSLPASTATTPPQAAAAQQSQPDFLSQDTSGFFQDF